MAGRQVGLLLIGLGLVVMAVGALAYFGALSWFGRLPGDLRFETNRSRVFIPLTSMLLVSVFLSLLAYLWRRLGE